MPANPPACGPSALLQQRPVPRERLQCLLRWPHRALGQTLFSSGVQPTSHRPLCEAVGRRPLSPAVFGYPSDISLFLRDIPLFLREEAHFRQVLDLDSRKPCLTLFLFVSNQWIRLYHFPPGSISSPAAPGSLPSCRLHGTRSPRQPGSRTQGQDRRHVGRSFLLPPRPKWQLGPAPNFQRNILDRGTQGLRPEKRSQGWQSSLVIEDPCLCVHWHNISTLCRVVGQELGKLKMDTQLWRQTA